MRRESHWRPGAIGRGDPRHARRGSASALACSLRLLRHGIVRCLIVLPCACPVKALQLALNLRRRSDLFQSKLKHCLHAAAKSLLTGLCRIIVECLVIHKQLQGSSVPSPVF